jgi:LysR family hydrogen peroxide-inducible transcriptional activator
VTEQELRYLVALADHGHFGRAAEACHISQPTLSSQLEKLEEDFRVVFFERTSKTLHITRVGQKIVDQARCVLAEAEMQSKQSIGFSLPRWCPTPSGLQSADAIPWQVI